MFRRLLIALFVITHLTGPIGAAYAYSCAMMGAAPALMKQCCCDPDEATPPCDGEGSATGDCCEKVVIVTDLPGDEAGQTASPPNPLKWPPQAFPAAPAMMLSVALTSLPGDASWEEVHRFAPLGTDLYLRTLRLRL